MLNMGKRAYFSTSGKCAKTKVLAVIRYCFVANLAAIRSSVSRCRSRSVCSY